MRAFTEFTFQLAIFMQRLDHTRHVAEVRIECAVSKPDPTLHRDGRETLAAKRVSIRALQWTNFFLADVQAGLGPFVASYLAGMGWSAGSVGRALTFGGLVAVLLQTPAGWLIDRVAWKRGILVAGSLVLAAGALLLAFARGATSVYIAQGLIGSAAPLLAPTLAAITLGIVGAQFFDRQFGRNQGYNAGGNLAAAALIALCSHWFGQRAIFFAAALLVLPTILTVLRIRRYDIDPQLARGGTEGQQHPEGPSQLRNLAQDKVLLTFLLCAFLFHFANAAMLPQLGELLAYHAPRSAAPFMSACVAITQAVMLGMAAWCGRIANQKGRRGLLLLSFGVLPIRAVLYTLLHATPALLAVQLLDGVANSIFGVVSILVIADLTRGSGRFNLAQGALATAVGLGAAFSNTFGGTLMEKFGYKASFLSLGGAALLALLLLVVAVPETSHELATSAAS